MAPHTVIESDRPMPKDEQAEHRWLEVRGTRLHVAGYGTGEPILLLHGFPQHWFGWHRVAALAADGHRLVCPDLRGFGWSGQTRRGCDMDGLAEDVLALLDALGLERVGLVGHDWGAHLGFRLCLRAPDRFSGYLALNMCHPWPRHRAVVPNLWRMWFTAFVEYPVTGRAVLRHWTGFTGSSCATRSRIPPSGRRRNSPSTPPPPRSPRTPGSHCSGSTCCGTSPP
ncbi:alpha/beta fold hydrolase [Streptomyces sp. NPDC051636]|uniref:alpha/beta fold hydrolase n=1 Tax=Streptomyces sp. NPDC051636 TaxID=3365663 RepID=UPI003795708F